jgi:hypothetical protein
VVFVVRPAENVPYFLRAVLFELFAYIRLFVNMPEKKTGNLSDLDGEFV